ncbi:MAG TPA: Hsp70 family protein [Myxococcota bacterium]|nr:Hsp70 family protein [Myxococcota bacterium]
METFMGIDFGTSTTIAAVYADKKAAIIRSKTGEEIMPSYVAFTPDGKMQVGRSAQGRRVIDPTNTLFSFKRILGRNTSSPEVRAFSKQYPFTLEGAKDEAPRFVTRAGKLSAQEVCSYLLAQLHEAPAVTGQDIGRVCMTVPVSFRKEQRTAAISAAIGAGFRRVDVLEEPCAAALACMREDPREQTVMVYDLGGGTFDATVLLWTGTRFKVLGLGGDSYLGGDDITARCATWVADEVLKRFNWNIRTSETSWQRLLMTCDQVKVLLSVSQSQEISLAGVDEVLKDKSITLTREQMEKMCMDLVQRTFLICDETLRSASTNARKIQSVVLSGGCCHMPFIREAVKAYFGQTPRMQLPPDKVVALGAAIHAGEQSVMNRVF